MASSSSGWVMVPRSIMVVAMAEAHFSSADQAAATSVIYPVGSQVSQRERMSPRQENQADINR